MTAASHAFSPIPVSETLPWFAVQTRYRLEKKVTAHLHRKGVETFLPMLEEVHRWTDRNKKIQLPLFCGYVFARTSPSSRSRADVLQTEGVIRVVEFAGRAAPIPSKQIEDLRLLLGKKVPCALHAFLKVGQRVRIRGGCLDGLEGVLDERGEKALLISVEAIQRSVAIRIEGYELELI